jgi:hypothetical protein
MADYVEGVIRPVWVPSTVGQLIELLSHFNPDTPLCTPTEVSYSYECDSGVGPSATQGYVRTDNNGTEEFFAYDDDEFLPVRPTDTFALRIL